MLSVMFDVDALMQKLVHVVVLILYHIIVDQVGKKLNVPHVIQKRHLDWLLQETLGLAIIETNYREYWRHYIQRQILYHHQNTL